MKKSATTPGESPSRLIDAKIKALDDWRGKTLSHVRALIKQADPEVVVARGPFGTLQLQPGWQGQARHRSP